MKKTMNDTSEQPMGYARQEVRDQARNILKVWKANREFQMKDIKFGNYEKLYAEFDEIVKNVEARSRELAGMRKDREKLATKLGLLNTRARSGIRGYFGPQSSEFARVKVLQSHKAGRKARKLAAAKSGLPPTPPPPATPAPTAK